MFSYLTCAKPFGADAWLDLIYKGLRPESCRGLEPRWFYGDPASLARDNIIFVAAHFT